MERMLPFKESKDYHNLISQIGELLTNARGQVSRSVNDIMVRTYWGVGQYIVEFE